MCAYICMYTHIYVYIKIFLSIPLLINLINFFPILAIIINTVITIGVRKDKNLFMKTKESECL